MTLRILTYQQRVLGLLDAYLNELVKHRVTAEKKEQANIQQPDPDLHIPPFNFPEETWGKLKNIFANNVRREGNLCEMVMMNEYETKLPEIFRE